MLREGGNVMNRESAEKIIEGALGEGRKVLSEYESKRVLEAYGIPVTREVLVCEEKDVPRAAAEIGYPLVMKGCSAEIAHKTEKGLIRVDVRTSAEALAAFREIKHGLAGHKGGVLIQEMVRGRRELVMGLTRDGQFGPCVMFGLGGIFTEILKDIAFRRAPLSGDDAMAMMREIRAHAILVRRPAALFRIFPPLFLLRQERGNATSRDLPKRQHGVQPCLATFNIWVGVHNIWRIHRPP
jgi:acetyl-CoA synthetase (ADP-forming)